MEVPPSVAFGMVRALQVWLSGVCLGDGGPGGVYHRGVALVCDGPGSMALVMSAE